ncbi:hypothetical protein ACLUEY_09905 [Vreelandella aquamarina]
MADSTLSGSSLVYVCLMSDYSLPNLEAIMARQPSDAVLIVTEYKPAIDAAERMEEVLKNRLPSLRVHRPDREAGARPFEGDNPVEAQRWVGEVIAPYLERFKGQPCWLNMTGSTKTLTLAMLVRLPWEGIDYKPAGKNELLHFTLGPETSSPETPNPEHNALARLGEADPARTPLNDIAATDVAQLYNTNVKPSTTRTDIFPAAERHALAEALFNALDERDPALVALFALLNHVWCEHRDDIAFKAETVELPMPEALHQDAILRKDQPRPDMPALQAWLARFNTMAQAFHLDKQVITLPGNERGKLTKEVKALKKWLESDWLEQLVYHWVHQTEIPGRGIALNIHAGEDPRNSSKQREADLLIQHRSQTYVIEVKAAIPPGSDTRSIQTQLASLKDHFGRARLILFVGPAFKHQLSESKWQAFVDRVEAGNGKVCCTRQELLTALNLQPALEPSV